MDDDLELEDESLEEDPEELDLETDDENDENY